MRLRKFLPGHLKTRVDQVSQPSLSFELYRVRIAVSLSTPAQELRRTRQQVPVRSATQGDWHSLPFVARPVPGFTSTGQNRRSHQELIDGARTLPALANRPHHQRLPPPHVAGGEHFGHGGGVAPFPVRGGAGVAALVFVDAEGI